MNITRTLCAAALTGLGLSTLPVMALAQTNVDGNTLLNPAPAMWPTYHGD